MTDLAFHIAVSQALEKDPRYQPGAYDFVRAALHEAAKIFRDGEEDRHVTGQQLLEGFRRHALAEFGPMALTVLSEWGLHRGEDVGAIVYNLIEVGYFGINEGDSIEDFAGGYDFAKAFTDPFQPSSARKLPAA